MGVLGGYYVRRTRGIELGLTSRRRVYGMGWARPFRAIAMNRPRTEKRRQEFVDRSGT